jgi:hypothetical protein
LLGDNQPPATNEDRLLIQHDRHTPITPPLLLDFAKANLPNFPRRFQMGSATRLQIDAFDFQQPDFPGAFWRLH